MAEARVTVIIPARYKSSRFPGKPLADLLGRPMIAHVYERACRAAGVAAVVVATDDERIRAAVEAFGGTAVLTSEDHATGTDRVAEAAAKIEGDILVNVQGDEPLLDPVMIEEAIRPLLEDPAVQVVTLMSRIEELAEVLDTNTVKLVTDLAGNVLCFSRAPIPHPRERGAHRAIKQIGLYAFRRSALLKFAQWAQGPLEQTESVELFRFLEHGCPVRGMMTASHTIAVDTPGDLERVGRQLRAVRDREVGAGARG